MVFQSFHVMGKKRKLFLSFTGVAICLAFSLFTIKFILDGKYRNQLPEYPDFQTIPKSLQKQISVADRKAFLNPIANNLGKLGMVYYSSAYYEKAALCYQLAEKKNRLDWIWSYYLGYMNLELGESNASVENFRHIIEKDSKNYLALFYTAVAFQNLGLTLSAENIFKKIIALSDRGIIEIDTIRENDFPLQTYAIFRLARIYINSNSLDSAEMVLKELIDKQITFGPAYRLLGNVFTRKGDTILGKKYTIRANDLIEYTPPTDILIDKIALISRSDTYLLKQIDDAIRSRNFNWALKLIDHALKYNPENKYLISKAVTGYFSMGFDRMALPYLGQHIKYFSDDYNELMNIADFLYKKGFTLQALRYFDQAKKIKPDNSRLTLWLADRGMINEAISLLNEQLKKDPGNVKIIIDAVHLFLNLGEIEKAKTYLATLEPRSLLSPEVKKLSGKVAEMKGNLKEALSIYEDAYKNNPKDIYLIKYLVNIYLREKMWDKALHDFRLALNNFPNEPFFLEGLGRLLVSCPDPKLRNVNEGREYSERAFINFKSPFETKISAGRNLATVYAILGDQKNASRYINLTIDLARKGNVSQDYIPYFENLKRQYNISN